MNKKYRFGLDIWALVLFLIIMLPNFIWFAIPAPCDILRNESITPSIDTLASVIQVLMIATLCTIISKEKIIFHSINKKIIIVSVIIYYVGWVIYYSGIVSTLVILTLCIAPCVALVIYSFSKKIIWHLY